MSMDKGKSSIGTPCGAMCSLFMLVVILLYALQKTTILISKNDTNLQKTRLENYFDFSEPMTGADDGIFFAFKVFNAYNSKYGQLDSSYYRLSVGSYEFTFDEKSGDYVSNFTELKTHPCTMLELQQLGRLYVSKSEDIDAS